MSSGSPYRKQSPRRSAAWHFNRRRKYRDRQAGYVGWPLRVEQIVDRDNLYRSWQQLRVAGGAAPGIDGFTYKDLSNSEVGSLMGELSSSLLDGSYKPQPARIVDIAKPGTKECRRLRIATLCDRVVGKAVQDALSPFWEKRFLPGSYGFRPRRSTWQLLATLDVAVRRTGWRHLAVADIRKAFDNVPLAEVIDCHLRALARVRQANFSVDDRVRTLLLIQTVLQGDDPGRTRGIDQGGCYSPTGLNSLLHYHHDIPFTHDFSSELLWLRYADNLTYLGRNMSDGQHALEHVRRLLDPLGMALKAGSDVVDLTSSEVDLLGFRLQWDGERFHYRLSKDSLSSLRQSLEEAHTHANPPEAAKQILLGWIDATGPAIEHGCAVDALSLAVDLGFREILLGDVVRQADCSRTRWLVCLAHTEAAMGAVGAA